MEQCIGEEWCRAVLGKGGVKKGWGRIVWSSVGAGWREVLGKSGVEQCWRRVV